MLHKKRLLALLSMLILGVLTACDTGGGSTTPGAQNSGNKPANAVEVSIIYAPESALYMPRMIQAFNDLSAQGKNPVTGGNYANGAKPIWMVDPTNGAGGSSGTVMQGIINAIIAPNNQNVAKPVIFSPSVSHWLALANERSGRQLFDLANSQPTANAPVVMAIWESRLQAIRDKVGYEDIGWEELLQVLNSENGWCDYGIPDCRRTVFYGHTDPRISSTGLSTLISEFYAAARANGFTGRILSDDQVDDEAVQEGVRNIETLIRHYSSRTTEFKEYIAQGPQFLDFVALEENDLIFINEGKTQYKPPEKLVALYPKEGTFWHEHPFGIVNADWVTQEQKDAAAIFTQYVLLPAQQEMIMAEGFRPVNQDVQLAFPFVAENGVTVEGPKTVLDVPSADVIVAIQQSWSVVKKQADITLIIDTSGSMNDEDKIGQAKAAAQRFIAEMDPNNRVSLVTFSDNIIEQVRLGTLETVKTELTEDINRLRADGGTALFDAMASVLEEVNTDTASERIRAVVVLSDGADTASSTELNQVLRAIEASRSDLNPVIVIMVAYGSNADIDTLSGIARASSTTVQSGDPNNITRVLEIISSYF
ncbi:MAG: VWA domain-containing protein [Chloroflexi bacterium]|nr:VWA domain-containing protein [Chloroflexota bacterium]MCC6896103.1 VWA domain-containing protein [Anaerolineae bacterium]